MDHLSLPDDLERFAAEAVASGRYRDASDVVRAGLSLLREAEIELADFVTSLEQARIEGERDGFLAAGEVERRVRDAIAVAGQQAAK